MKGINVYLLYPELFPVLISYWIYCNFSSKWNSRFLSKRKDKVELSSGPLNFTVMYGFVKCNKKIFEHLFLFNERRKVLNKLLKTKIKWKEL